MAITKIQSNAFPASIDLSNIDLTLGANEVLTANIADSNITTAKIADGAVHTDKIADNNVTHAKLHTDMDLSGKTVTLPALSQAVSITSPSDAEGIKLLGRSSDDIGQIKFYENDGTTGLARIDARTTKLDIASYSDLHLSAGGVATDSVVIKSSGNVGIGTTGPSYKLDVNGSSRFVDPARFENYIGFAGAISTPQTAAAIYRPVDNELAFSTRNAERIRIDLDGNVGIGTTSPGEKLHVYGSGQQFIKVETTTTGAAAFVGMRMQDGDGDLGSIGDFGSGRRAFMLDTGSGVDMMFFTNNQNNSSDTPRLTITSGGNVGIGTTDPGFAKFNVQGATVSSNGVLTQQGAIWVYNRNFVNTGVNNNALDVLIYGYDQANWNNQWIKVEVFNRYYWSGGEGAWILDSQSGSARELYSNNVSGSWSTSTTQINSNLTRRTWTWNGSQYRTYGFRITHGMTPTTGDPSSGQIKHI